MIQVGFVQFCPLRNDVGANIAQLARLLESVKAELLVLPELANSGYLYDSPAQLAPNAEDGDGEGPFLGALRKLAERSGALIVAGFAEAAAEGLYNSAALVDAGGVRQVYRKTHLFSDEKKLFLPGDTGFGVLRHCDATIGTMICFDWIFPESARTLALAGAQIIAHPANLVLPWCQQAMVTRSLENGVFSITANRYGEETCGDSTLRFTGASQVLDNKGRRLVAAQEQGDCVGLAAIEPQRADDKTLNPRNDLFRDRRVEKYKQ